MKSAIQDYRVAFRKKGTSKEIVMNIGVDDPARLEKIVMDMAKVTSLDELDQFESHLIKSDGSTEVREHVKERPYTPPASSPTVTPIKVASVLPQPMGVLTRFFKTATAQVKAYA